MRESFSIRQKLQIRKKMNSADSDYEDTPAHFHFALFCFSRPCPGLAGLPWSRSPGDQPPGPLSLESSHPARRAFEKSDSRARVLLTSPGRQQYFSNDRLRNEQRF